MKFWKQAKVFIKYLYSLLIFLETFMSESSLTEVWFTEQNYKPLEIEDKVNVTLVINYSITCTK